MMPAAMGKLSKHLNAVLLDHMQKLQGRARGVPLAALPLTDRAHLMSRTLTIPSGLTSLLK
jgi:hypothetical protein